MAKGGSSGKHGGGHKDRDRDKDGGAGRKAADRRAQARIAKARGQRDTSGRKGKPSGR
jgi:hypothetical protein